MDLKDFDYEQVGHTITLKRYKGQPKSIITLPVNEDDKVVKYDDKLFNDYWEIGKIIIPKGFFAVHFKAFANSYIHELVFEEGIKIIPLEMLPYFSDCIIFPSTLTCLQNGPFPGDMKIKKVMIRGENDRYTCGENNDMIYDKIMKKLYLLLKSCDIPKDCEIMGTNCNVHADLSPDQIPNNLRIIEQSGCCLAYSNDVFKFPDSLLEIKHMGLYGNWFGSYKLEFGKNLKELAPRFIMFKLNDINIDKDNEYFKKATEGEMFAVVNKKTNKVVMASPVDFIPKDIHILSASSIPQSYTSKMIVPHHITSFDEDFMSYEFFGSIKEIHYIGTKEDAIASGLEPYLKRMEQKRKFKISYSGE